MHNISRKILFIVLLCTLVSFCSLGVFAMDTNKKTLYDSLVLEFNSNVAFINTMKVSTDYFNGQPGALKINGFNYVALRFVVEYQPGATIEWDGVQQCAKIQYHDVSYTINHDSYKIENQPLQKLKHSLVEKGGRLYIEIEEFNKVVLNKKIEYYDNYIAILQTHSEITEEFWESIEKLFMYENSEKKQYFRIYENGLFGFIDEEGSIVIAPQYKYAEQNSFKEGLAAVRTVDGIVKFISPSNETVIDFGKIIGNRYGCCEGFREGIAECVISEEGEIKNIKYVNKLGDDLGIYIQNVEKFAATLYGCKVEIYNNEVTITNKSGNILAHTVLDSDCNIQEASYVQDYIIFTKNEDEDIKYGLMDIKGNVVLNAEYSFIQVLKRKGVAGDSENLYFIRTNNNEPGYFVRDEGIPINDRRYDNVRSQIGRSELYVYENNRWGLLDSNFQYILQPQYAYIELGKDDVALATTYTDDGDSNYYMIDLEGNVIYNNGCRKLYLDSEAKIGVLVEKEAADGTIKSGYIDWNGNLIYECDRFPERPLPG